MHIKDVTGQQIKTRPLRTDLNYTASPQITQYMVRLSQVNKYWSSVCQCNAVQLW